MNYRLNGKNLTRKEIKDKKRIEAESRSEKTIDADRRKNRIKGG